MAEAVPSCSHESEECSTLEEEDFDTCVENNKEFIEDEDKSGEISSKSSQNGKILTDDEEQPDEIADGVEKLLAKHRK